MHIDHSAPAQDTGSRVLSVVRLGLRVGTLATAVLLLTAACSADSIKDAACKGANGFDSLLGIEPSAERTRDCGVAGQSAARKADAGSRHMTDRSTVKDVQARLGDLGYDPGPADGQMGPQTRAAIRAYQRDEGLTADGQITAKLVRRIKADSRS